MLTEHDGERIRQHKSLRGKTETNIVSWLTSEESVANANGIHVSSNPNENAISEVLMVPKFSFWTRFSRHQVCPQKDDRAPLLHEAEVGLDPHAFLR